MSIRRYTTAKPFGFQEGFTPPITKAELATRADENIRTLTQPVLPEGIDFDKYDTIVLRPAEGDTLVLDEGYRAKGGVINSVELSSDCVEITVRTAEDLNVRLLVFPDETEPTNPVTVQAETYNDRGFRFDNPSDVGYNYTPTPLESATWGHVEFVDAAGRFAEAGKFVISDATPRIY
ncbi:MAG: hypothetical protein V4702_01925 [Patescibacteria group bacterium]